MESQTESVETSTVDLTYTEMFAQWVAGESWVDPYDPLVFHIKKVCATLDAQIRKNGEASGPANTAYLQALTRLERKRPGAATGPQMEGQTSIFDEGF